MGALFSYAKADVNANVKASADVDVLDNLAKAVGFEEGAVKAWMESGAIKGIEGVDIDVLNNLREMVGIQQGGVVGIEEGGVIGIEEGGVVGIEEGGVVGIESGGVSINTGGVSILVIAVVVVILFFILIMYLIRNNKKEMKLGENAVPLRDKVFRSQKYPCTI